MDGVKQCNGHVKTSTGVEYRVGLPTAFSPDMSLALSPTNKKLGNLSLWEVRTGKEIRDFEWMPNASSLAISADGTMAAAGYGWDEIRVIRLPGGEEVKSLGSIAKIASTDKWVTALWFTPDGKKILAQNGFRMQLWDIDSAQIERSVPGFEHQSLFCLSSDGKIALSGGGSGSLAPPFPVVLWDIATGTPIRRFVKHHQLIRTAAFADGGNAVVSLDMSGTLKRWDAKTGDVFWSIRLWDKEGYWASAEAISVDGKLAVIAESDVVKLWDVEKGKLLRQFNGRDGW